MNFWFHDICLVYCVPPPERLPSTAQRLKEMAVLGGGDATRNNHQRKQKPSFTSIFCANIHHNPFKTTEYLGMIVMNIQPSKP